MIESSKKVAPWRTAVAGAARARIAPWGADWFPFDGPVAVRMLFALRRPLRPVRSVPDRTPDLSKLARSTEDAMTGIIWTDDARVVRYDLLEKVYEGSPKALECGLEQTGVAIAVRCLDD